MNHDVLPRRLLAKVDVAAGAAQPVPLNKREREGCD